MDIKKILVIMMLALAANMSFGQLDNVQLVQAVLPVKVLNERIAEGVAKSMDESAIYSNMAAMVSDVLPIVQSDFMINNEQAIALLSGTLDVTTLSPQQRALIFPDWHGTVDRLHSGSLSKWETRNLKELVLVGRSRRTDLKSALIQAAGSREQFLVDRFLFARYPYKKAHLTTIMNRLQVKVRKALRRDGKGIVSYQVTETVGTNEVTRWVHPVEVAMLSISDVMNAPMLEGLEAVIGEFGIDIDVDRSMIADLENIKDLAWVGDKEAWKSKDALRLLLGTDGYNAWVVEYNAH